MLDKFEANYAGKLDDGEDKYVNIWNKLQSGQDVTVEEEQEIVRVHGPAPYIVDLKDFYARLKIKDLYRHTVIGEHLDMTWIDIDSRKNQNYYDSKAVDELENKDKKEFANKDYRIREDIVMFDLKEDGKIRRFIVTYDEETKIILRCIYYPYRHGKIHFVIYNAIPRKDSWLGYSFTKRMEDVCAIANAFVNSAINEFTLGHTPVVLTDDENFQGGRITIENLSVLRFKTGSKFQPMVFQPASMDRVAFLNWVVNFTELLTGVSASLMSGAETPSDPRAPYAKSALKFKSSAMRVEDVVHEMQKGDAELAEQCDKIYYQFPAKDEDAIEYYKGTDKHSINIDVFDKNVRYVMQGSRLSFDKSQDLQVAMTTGAYIMQFHPEVWRDPEARYELLSIVLNSSEGSVEKKKDAIIKPLREYIDAMRKIKEKQQEAKGTPEEQDQGLRDRIAQMKSTIETPPAQPAAQPAQGAAQ
jgi:hypothetical protein